MLLDKSPLKRAAIVAAIVMTIGLCAAAATTGSATTTAQQKTGTAFISINLEAGFPLDPFLVSVQGGGPAAASTLAKNCTGYVPANPTVTVDFKGKADVLRAFFHSDGDPTLVVRTPDGKFVCNDDTNRLILDPTVEISKPGPGRYDVWVGSTAAKDLVPGFLAFTTRNDMNAARLDLASLVKRSAAPEMLPLRDRLVNAAKRVEQAAAVKSADAFSAGGKPVTKEFTASGDLPAVELQTGDTLCGGLVNVAPDYAFDWSGDAKSLTILAEANGDTTLLVRTPDGSFLCADDADGMRNLNPLLAIAKPAAGRHLVWVGRVDPSKPVTGTLTFTEAADAKPKALRKP